MKRSVRGTSPLGLALPLVLGCSSVDGYTTGANESYCGGLPSPASFTTGLAPGATMRLTLNAALLDGDTSPGRVWTNEPAGTSSTGSTGSPARKLLDGVALVRMPALDNDPLGSPDLGGGRDPTRLYTLVASPPGELPLLAAVSLRSDGGVDVRLLRPGATPTTTTPTSAPIFGAFTLTKQAGTCGF